jgi:YihY family inner membrane protein
MAAHTTHDVRAAEEPTVVAEDEAGGDENVLGRALGAGKGVLGRVDAFQRDHRPTAVTFAVFKKFGDDQAGNLAALVAYYTFFSLFPLLLVLVTGLGFVLSGNTELQTRLLDSALSQFPVVGDQLRTNIGGFKGSGVALAIGIVGALWGGMGALDAMQNAMNTVWNVPKVHRPNLIQTRLRGLIMLVVLVVTIGASTGLSSAGAVADSLGIVGKGLVLLLSVALNVAVFTLSFKVLTEYPIDWKAFVPGGVVAGVAFTVLQAVGGWYVERTLGTTQVYGIFAIVLGLLSWLYLLSQVTVMAAEVNVVVAKQLWPRSLTGENLTQADIDALRHYAVAEERIPEETVRVELPEPAAPGAAEPDRSDQDQDQDGYSA